MTESFPQELPQESFPRRKTHRGVISFEKYRALKKARQEGALPQREAVKQMLTAMLNGAVSEQELKEKLSALSVEKALPFIQSLKENTEAISKMTDELKALKQEHAALRSRIVETLYAMNEENEEEE